MILVLLIPIVGAICGACGYLAGVERGKLTALRDVNRFLDLSASERQRTVCRDLAAFVDVLAQDLSGNHKERFIQAMRRQGYVQ